MKKSGRYKTDGLVEDQYEDVAKGLKRDYQPMTKFFNEAISRILQAYEGE
jgi:hypothetical protein